MTDARYPERWLTDRRVLRLSDAAHRLFVVALTWSVSNRTDGVIDDDDLPLVPGTRRELVSELAAAGLLVRQSGGWFLTVYVETQSTRTQLEAAEHARAMDRDRKARERKRKAAARTTVTPDIRPDIPPDVAGDDTGKARQGQARPIRAAPVIEDHADEESVKVCDSGPGRIFDDFTSNRKPDNWPTAIPWPVRSSNSVRMER